VPLGIEGLAVGKSIRTGNNFQSIEHHEFHAPLCDRTLKRLDIRLRVISNPQPHGALLHGS
jgi:hypothetical protein